VRRARNQRMIDRRRLFRIVGSAVLVVGLELAISSLLWGCSNGVEVTKVTQGTIGSGTSVRPELPSLDRAAPGSFQTASFAFG
jgi:hypothetical protein